MRSPCRDLGGLAKRMLCLNGPPSYLRVFTTSGKPIAHPPGEYFGKHRTWSSARRIARVLRFLIASVDASRIYLISSSHVAESLDGKEASFPINPVS